MGPAATLLGANLLSPKWRQRLAQRKDGGSVPPGLTVGGWWGGGSDCSPQVC